MEGAQQLHTGQPVHHLSCSYSICFSPLPTPTSELPGPALGAIIQADGNPSSRRLWGENAIRSGYNRQGWKERSDWNSEWEEGGSLTWEVWFRAGQLKQCELLYDRCGSTGLKSSSKAALYRPCTLPESTGLFSQLVSTYTNLCPRDRENSAQKALSWLL